MMKYQQATVIRNITVSYTVLHNGLNTNTDHDFSLPHLCIIAFFIVTYLLKIKDLNIHNTWIPFAELCCILVDS